MFFHIITIFSTLHCFVQIQVLNMVVIFFRFEELSFLTRLADSSFQLLLCEINFYFICIFKRYFCWVKVLSIYFFFQQFFLFCFAISSHPFAGGSKTRVRTLGTIFSHTLLRLQFCFCSSFQSFFSLLYFEQFLLLSSEVH